MTEFGVLSFVPRLEADRLIALDDKTTEKIFRHLPVNNKEPYEAIRNVPATFEGHKERGMTQMYVTNTWQSNKRKGGGSNNNIPIMKMEVSSSDSENLERMR